MGWTAWYQVLLDRHLTDDEKRGLGALVRRVNEQPWDSEAFDLGIAAAARVDRVVAQGWTKLAQSLDESKDARRLVDALNDVLQALPAAEIRVSDDYKAFGWDAAAKRIAIGARPTPDLIDVPSDQFVAATSFAPQAVGLPAELARLAGGSGAISDAGVVERALTLLAELEPPHPDIAPLEGILARCDKNLIARAGLPRYGTLHGKAHAWRIVCEALAIAEVAPLLPRFLEIWSKGEGLYWHHDMYLGDAFEDRLAAEPTIVQRLEEDILHVDGPVEAEERLYRRAERAIALLARRRTDRTLAFLLNLVKRARERRMPFEHDHRVRNPALRALAPWNDARCFPTFAIELGRMTDGQNVIHSDMARSIVRSEPARARPIIGKLAELWSLGSRIIEPLAVLGETAALQRALPALIGPHRQEAIRRLRELGVTIDPALEADPPYEALIAHPSREIRHEALRKIHDRKDPTTFLSLVLAEAIDADVRARSKEASLPFSWWSWKEILPEKAPQASIQAKLTWAQREGRARLGEQVIFDVVRPALEQGSFAVSQPIPSTLLRWSREEREALLAEEAQVLRALGG